MKESREKEILAFLQKEKYAKIERISEALFISSSTVRRNLAELESKGLVNRTHGGAEIKDENSHWTSFTFRATQNSVEKKKIALAARGLVKNGDILFLDGSTTSFYLAEYLSEFKDVKVITNGVDTLSLLAKNGVTAYSTGGVISTENPSVLVGHYAENMIESVRADVAFFSVQSINSKGEMFDCYEKELAPRLKMMKNAEKSVLLFDDTKWEKSSAFRLGNLSDVDYVVCNRDLRERFDCERLPQFVTFE